LSEREACSIIRQTLLKSITLCVLLTVLWSTACAALRPAQLTPCQVGGTTLVVHCGAVEVYEDRKRHAGRKLPLKVIEVDATHPSHWAVFWNPGGPGGADSDYVPAITAGAVAGELLRLHDTYDLVFVNNRGTGEGGLQCNGLYSAAHPEYFFARLFPAIPLRACRDRLSKIANLSMYTTDISADDLDDVRAALKYSKIVLDGDSYGTTLFLDYARRHPSHVESLVLQGVAPPGIYVIPLPFARGAQNSMTDLIAGCSHEDACQRKFPELAAHFKALVHRFGHAPPRVRVKNWMTFRQQTVVLSNEVFADQLRHAMYGGRESAYIPEIIERAHDYDYSPLAELVETEARSAYLGTAMGLNLSVTCAEDIPFITESETARTSAGSFEGDMRIRAQQRACRIWNVGRVSAAFVQPVRSSAPVLMISGQDDPATPACLRSCRTSVSSERSSDRCSSCGSCERVRMH